MACKGLYQTCVRLSCFCLILALASCGGERKSQKYPERAPAQPSATLRGGKPYTIAGITYYPIADAAGFKQSGMASWYGRDFHGKKTANGEVYDMYAMTAAHKTLPLGTMVEVRRVDNGQAIAVRINDRGPFVSSRIIDLSMAGAEKLGIVQEGTTRVTVTALAEGAQGQPGEAPEPLRPLPDFNRGVFWVQVGAFGVIANAERARERLGLPQERTRLQPVNNGPTPIYRVQAGPYRQMDLANRALLEAVELGFIDSFVVAD